MLVFRECIYVMFMSDGSAADCSKCTSKLEVSFVAVCSIGLLRVGPGDVMDCRCLRSRESSFGFAVYQRRPYAPVICVVFQWSAGVGSW